MIGIWVVDFLGKKNGLWHEGKCSDKLSKKANSQSDISQTYRTEIYSSLMLTTRHRAFKKKVKLTNAYPKLSEAKILSF